MGNRNKFKCIYVLLCPNKAAYVGQTTDPINRKSRYKTMTCKNQRRVYGSLLIHGFEKHEFKIILTLPDSSTRSDMDYYENFYYELYKAQGFDMLNLKSPGWNGRPCAESIGLLSKAHVGQRAWNKGLKGVQEAWNKGLKKADYGKR